MSGKEDDWHAWRKNGVGGSEIAGLLGASRWASPWSIWASKAGLVEPSEGTQRQRIGKRMESVLAAEFEDVRPGLFVVGEQTWCEHPKHSWARCTVDGFVADAPDSDPLAVIEFKSDSRFGWDEVPANYRMQCLWNMGVTGMRSAFLAVMFAGFRFEVFEVAWDQAEWDLMLDVAGTFWHENVMTGVPPLADGSEATADALARAYPEHLPGVEVALDDLARVVGERDYLKAERKHLDDKLAEIDNAIKARLADAEVGTIDGVPILTYRSTERAGYTVPPATIRTLRNAAKPKERQTK